MRKTSTEDYYRDFAISSMNWSDRVIHIAWKIPSKGIRSESCLYRHCDGSWHLDADSKSYGIPFAKALSSGMARFFLASFCPAAQEVDYRGPSELARIERILLQEKQYRDALARRGKEKAERPHRISVWRADDVKQ